MTVPNNYDALKAVIAETAETLSPRLRQVAEFALRNPNDMALETVAVIADRAGVQPSTLIRFANAFGFDGFSTMQRVFQQRLVSGTSSYAERIRQLKEAGSDGTPGNILRDLVDAGIRALEHLRSEVQPDALQQAIELLAQADIVYVAGQRRSYAAAAYLTYALGHLDRRAFLVDGIGGMARQQAAGMTGSDVLIATSFTPYAPETLELVKSANARDVPVIAITDSPLSPLFPRANVTFEVEDAELRGFRALSATMCLSLSLVVGLGQRLAADEGTEKRPLGM